MSNASRMVAAVAAVALGVAGFAAVAWRGAEAQAPAAVRIGLPGQDVDAQAFYAQDLGFFRKYGIAATLDIIRRGGGAAVAAAVTGGAVELGDGDLASMAEAHEKGIPLVLLAPAALFKGDAPTTELIVKKGSPLHAAKDLEGKTVALIGLAGPSRLAMDAWLHDGGADPSKISFVELPPVEMAANVDRGTVAAALINEPALTAAQAACCTVMANPFATLGREWLLGGWYATSAWVAKNPDVAKRVAAALREAAIWGDNPANHQRSGEILDKYTPFPADLLAHMTRATYGVDFTPATLQPLLTAAYKGGELKAPVQGQTLLSSVAAMH